MYLIFLPNSDKLQLSPFSVGDHDSKFISKNPMNILEFSSILGLHVCHKMHRSEEKKASPSFPLYFNMLIWSGHQ